MSAEISVSCKSRLWRKFGTWRIAKPERRERVQNPLFEGGLDCSPKSGFLNRCKSSIFNEIKTVDLRKKIMVEAAGVGLKTRVDSTDVIEF